MSFTLTLTTAGLDALVNAQSGSTGAIQITQVGFSNASYVAAPTLTAQTGEFKRIGAISGVVISETVIHMTAQDPSADIYDLRSFALYLSDGTLFAAYSQADPIVSKAAVLNLQLAFDVAFQDGIAGDIEFGDATFLFPPATETVKGVAEIATQAEVNAGTDDQRFVTPLKLAVRLAAAFGAIVSATETAEGVAEIATQAEVNAGTDDRRFVTALKLAQRLAPILQSITNESAARAAAIAAEASARQNSDTTLGNSLSALINRTITGGGLAQGGGNLSANRVISVAAASFAQIIAGLDNNAAITPGGFGPIVRSFGPNGYIALALADPANALCIQWGQVTASPNGVTNVSFPIAFAQQAFAVVCDGTSDSNTNRQDNFPAVLRDSISSTGFQLFSANDIADAVNFIAIGRVNLS